MVLMIATKKLKYGTRRLTAGDPFEARHDRDARLLIGIGKARYATRVMVADDAPVITKSMPVELPIAPAPMPVELAPISGAAETDERPALRAEYEVRFGKKAFPGWSAELLKSKLAEA